jgi:hypothetical protein
MPDSVVSVALDEARPVDRMTLFAVQYNLAIEAFAVLD